MAYLRKTDIQRRTDTLKQLILTGQPFEKDLARLYIDLALQAKHSWLVQTYHLLLLYIPDTEQHRLYHPALLQAMIQLAQWQEAEQIARVLRQQNPADPETLKLCKALQAHTETTLPAYTPLASLSRYAQYQMPSGKHAATALPASWQEALQRLTTTHLEELGYYRKVKQLARWPRKYRQTLTGYFDELFLSYLFQHKHSVVVLAGALLEMLLAIYLQERLQLHKINIGRQSKKIFELTLYDLLQTAAQRDILPPNTLRLCRAARMQRNFIHPGKEILEQQVLRLGGSQICFLAVMETIDALSLRPGNRT